MDRAALHYWALPQHGAVECLEHCEQTLHGRLGHDLVPADPKYDRRCADVEVPVLIGI